MEHHEQKNDIAAEPIPEKEDAILVSVVIPVYNVGRYLPQCLESVLRQSYRELEIIIIDDGSTDGSGSICDSFARRDGRIRVLHTENKGLAAARNLGPAIAEGSYLMFLDSDDWIEPDTVKTLLETAIRYEADIVAAGFCREFVDQTLHPPKKTEQLRIFRGDDILSAFAEGTLGDRVWDKLYRTGCFSAVRFPDGHNYEDVATTWKILTDLAGKSGTVAVLPDELFHFRRRRSSISHTGSLGNTVDYWTACRKKYEGFPGDRDPFLAVCITAIGRMWARYSGFSEEEKRIAEEYVCEMQRFSKTHFHRIMKGSFSQKTKAICLVSHWKTPPVMRLCNSAGSLRRAIARTKYSLFD